MGNSYTCWYCKEPFGPSLEVASQHWGACRSCSKKKLEKLWVNDLSAINTSSRKFFISLFSREWKGRRGRGECGIKRYH